MIAKLLSFLLCASALWAGGLPAPVYPMVPMFHRWDYEKSVERIGRTAETGAKRVSFTVLLLAELEPGFKVKHYGAVWPRIKADGAEEYVFQPVTPAMRQEIRAALQTAFAEAVKRGLEINVLPQIDASGGITEWRNYFDFDPTAKRGEFSYESAMLETVLEALEAAVPAGHPVEMSLEGEMGCSLFRYPAAWHGIMEGLRARGKLTNLRLGISANYEGVTGKVQPDAVQQAGMHKLIAASDFVGLSLEASGGDPERSIKVEDFHTSSATGQSGNLNPEQPQLLMAQHLDISVLPDAQPDARTLLLFVTLTPP